MEKRTIMEALVEKAYEKGGFNGTWLYAENGGIVSKGAFGWRDAENTSASVGKKAGYVSRAWMPDFCNARRNGNDFDVRYEAFAAAESFYLDHAIVVPGFISVGSYQATKLNGFEGQYAMMG